MKLYAKYHGATAAMWFSIFLENIGQPREAPVCHVD
jgi:hypothetical protein